MLVFLSLPLSSLVLDFNCLELSSKAKHRAAFILSGPPSHGAWWGLCKGWEKPSLGGLVLEKSSSLAHDPKRTMKEIKFLAWFQEGKTILFIEPMCSSQACDLRLPRESIDAVSSSSKALCRQARIANYIALMTAHDVQERSPREVRQLGK